MLPIKNINTVIQKSYKPWYFSVNNTELLFFDIFYKNNKIYLIMPIYNAPALSEYITVNINNKILKLSNSHVKDSNEPILIYIYEYISQPNTVIKVNISLINNMTKSYELRHIYTNPTTNIHQNTVKNNNNFLALTTLFKHDYYLFPLFYNYYKKQGVQHFYMYYNGIITPEISKIFDKPDVTLVEWNYQYWNPRGVKYPHHAQMGQIHHALYKYGKDIYEYMIFCDLDEYLHIPKNKFIESTPPNLAQYSDNTLKQFIINKPDIDIFGFCNFWANTIDDSIPSTPYLPKKFLAVSEPTEYKERSKNIYKVSSINTIGVHQIGYDFYSSLTSITDLNMYHFYKWSSKNRVIENCTSIVNLDLL
jgi:hypothetical protein